MSALFGAGIVSAILLSAFAAPAIAQAPSPLAGTWALAEADEIKADGTRIQNYGPDAQGRLIVDDEGRYSLQIFRQGRARFASGDKFRGSPDEYREAVHGMSTHYGRLELDADAHILAFHIDQAAFPNWEGAVQRRRYELIGGRLSYEVPPAADGTVARSVWRRLD
jgi:hypothetical protein